MSRHISGWLPAMRVKSLKPLAAKLNSCAAFGLDAMSSTSANASKCGRWLTAAKMPSWLAAVISLTLAPHCCQRAFTRCVACGSVSGVGVSTTFLLIYKSAMAALTPLFSAPAIGCPPTNWLNCLPRISCAHCKTSLLVLPASVMTVDAAKCGLMAFSIEEVCATGAAINMMSASVTAAATSLVAASITPRSSAACRLCDERPTPMICAVEPAFFRASATEPPISPTPKITIFFKIQILVLIKIRLNCSI